MATIGCSGALFGVLIAYAILFPDVLFFGVIKAKWFVTIIGAVNLLDGIASRNAGVSHVAHLGGMLFGWLLIRYWRGQPPFGGPRSKPRPPNIRIVR